MESKRPIALFLTYTMKFPIVGGAFFRALRLALELERRGWSPVICNSGPALDDPKIEAARPHVQFVQLTGGDLLTSRLAALEPAVVIMGEGPFETMRPVYDAAKSLGRPFVVLDQFYNPWLLPMKDGVDLVLLYALGCFWPQERKLLKRPYELTPPFIEQVNPLARLPIPSGFMDRPSVTFIAYDNFVLRAGLQLLASAPAARCVVVCPSPPTCLHFAAELSLHPARLTVLPLQDDATLFGLLQHGTVALVSNGFIQIMDCLALGVPVVALKRGSGVGMTELNVDRRFWPYVSLQEEPETQRAKLASWLLENPIPGALRNELANERGGIAHCANRIESVVAGWEKKSAGWPARAARLARSTAAFLRGSGPRTME